LDALRGFLILGMVLVHLSMDLANAGWIPAWAAYSVPAKAIRTVGAGMFVFLSGVTAGFSGHNLRRGGTLLAVGVCITAASLLVTPDAPVYWGILHLLGACRCLYVPLRGKLTGKPGSAVLPGGALLILGLLLWRIPTALPWLLPLGLHPEGLSMGDYFPILPWMGVFLWGTAAGEAVFARKLPEKWYALRFPRLEWVGRRSLCIYLLHQPVLLLMLGCIGMFSEV